MMLANESIGSSYIPDFKNAAIKGNIDFIKSPIFTVTLTFDISCGIPIVRGNPETSRN